LIRCNFILTTTCHQTQLIRCNFILTTTYHSTQPIQYNQSHPRRTRPTQSNTTLSTTCKLRQTQRRSRPRKSHRTHPARRPFDRNRTRPTLQRTLSPHHHLTPPTSVY